VWPLLADRDALRAACDALTSVEQVPARQRAAEAIARCEAAGIVAISADAPAYPRLLTALPDPPPVLYALGDVSFLTRPAVAIVGSRTATPYGLRVARRLAGDLAARGIVVVSGLAMGIDAEAHRAALECGEATIAVMGTGVDVPYPRGHVALHERMARHGLVVSERWPGAPAHPGSFPRRNRLIAALAEVTVVVEAGPRSGALITARVAGEIGRLFGAVPGPVDVEQSQGSNALLRDGSQPIKSAEDVLGLLALVPDARGRAGPTHLPREGVSRERPSVSSAERKVLDVLRAGPRMTDELVTAAALAPRDVLAALASLELLGLVRAESSGLVTVT
jgi:DNA processing protein